MEGNTYATCLATALDFLRDKWEYICHERLDGAPVIMELKFLKMFFWGLDYREETDDDSYFRFAIDILVAKLRQINEEFVADYKTGYISKVQWPDLEVVMYDLERKINEQLIRSQAKDVCLLLLGGDFKCTSCPGNRKKFSKYVEDATSFLDLIQENLKALLDSNLIAPVVKQHVALVQQGLQDFCMFVSPSNKLFDLIPQTRAWFNRISYLTYLYWIDGSDGSLASNMEIFLSTVLLQKTTLRTTSGMITPFFESVKYHQLIAGHVDFLLQDLIAPTKDGTRILHEG